MKVYKAKLYTLHPRVPHFTLNCLAKNVGEHKIKITSTDEVNLGVRDKIFKENETIYVRKKFFILAEDIITGFIFPRIYIEERNYDIGYSAKYKVVQSNQRLYAHLERQLTSSEVKKIYEECSDEYITEVNEKLTNLIFEQEQYQQELPKSNKQYVKLLKQKRNSCLNK